MMKILYQASYFCISRTGRRWCGENWVRSVSWDLQHSEITHRENKAEILCRFYIGHYRIYSGVQGLSKTCVSSTILKWHAPPTWTSLCSKRVMSFAIYLESYISGHATPQNSSFSRWYCGNLDVAQSCGGGVTQKCVAKLQRILNFAPRVIHSQGKSEHGTLPLTELNWVTAKNRLNLYTKCIMYRAAHGQVPANICELFPRVCDKSERTSRQSGDFYTPPTTKKPVAGKRYASCRDTVLRNGLALELKAEAVP